MVWKTLWKRKVVSAWMFLTEGTDDYIRQQQGLNQYGSEDCRPELIWFGLSGSALWSDETKFQFLSLSLLFMDGLSFRLMCKPDSYQSSRQNPMSVIVSESLKCLQNWNFPCDSTSDAKCYKPEKRHCLSTGLYHVKNTSIVVQSLAFTIFIQLLHL